MSIEILSFIMPAESDRRGQLMLLGGISLLIWVLFRRHMRTRNDARQSQREFDQQRRQWAKLDNTGFSLNDAPKEVTRWQAGMFDLQRELKAELDTRIAVVQSLVRMADQRIADLQQLQGSLPGSRAGVHDDPVRQLADQVRQLADLGHTSDEIAQQTKLSLGDVEFLRGLA